VRTVEDAIAQLQRDHFDLVISDWHLGTSSMSGVELLRAFRFAGWAIPFGLIAAEVDDLRHAVATNAGAAFVLEKPFTPDTLAKAIGLREVDDWVLPTHARGLRFSSVEEELSASLSRLCNTAVTVMPSPVGTDLHLHRVAARYATGQGPAAGRVVFEIRLAASLAGAMTRVAPPQAERSASGILGEVLTDALAELGDVLTRFVSRPARNVRFERLDTYAPGERCEPGDGDRRVQNFYVAVTGYDAGVVSLATEALAAS
jgi:CheY-like chemotaxis protein